MIRILIEVPATAREEPFGRAVENMRLSLKERFGDTPNVHGAEIGIRRGDVQQIEVAARGLVTKQDLSCCISSVVITFDKEYHGKIIASDTGMTYEQKALAPA